MEGGGAQLLSHCPLELGKGRAAGAVILAHPRDLGWLGGGGGGVGRLVWTGLESLILQRCALAVPPTQRGWARPTQD